MTFASGSEGEKSRSLSEWEGYCRKGVQTWRQKSKYWHMRIDFVILAYRESLVWLKHKRKWQKTTGINPA